jgi:hypothetical protein
VCPQPVNVKPINNRAQDLASGVEDFSCNSVVRLDPMRGELIKGPHVALVIPDERRHRVFTLLHISSLRSSHPPVVWGRRVEKVGLTIDETDNDRNWTLRWTMICRNEVVTRRS